MTIFNPNLAMQVRRASLAALALLAVTLPSTQAAAPISGPGKTSSQSTTPVETTSGQITSPGDPFYPPFDPRPDTPWYLQGDVKYDCIIMYDGKHYFVQLYSTSDMVIPAGTKVVWLLPGGQWMTYILKEDWYPKTEILVDVPSMGSPELWNAQKWGDNSCLYTNVETGYSGPEVLERGINGLKPDPDKY